MWPVVLVTLVLLIPIAAVLARILAGRASGDGWAPFFSPGRQAAFEQEVRRYFDERAIPHRMADGVVYRERAGQEPSQLGLSNLAQVCNQASPAEWPAIISRHFDTLAQVERETDELQEKLHDLSRVRDRLMVRLTAKEDIPPEAELVSREDLPGILTYLALDLPTSVRSIHRADADAWGRTTEELFNIALENVRQQCRPEIRQVDMGDGILCEVMAGDSFFVASHALLLHEYPQCLGMRGALVAIPTRHSMLAYPINDMGVLKAVQALIAVAQGMAKDGPGSITARLFWYHGGVFTDLPYRVERKKLQFHPPNEFVAMLNGLAEAVA